MQPSSSIFIFFLVFVSSPASLIIVLLLGALGWRWSNWSLVVVQIRAAWMSLLFFLLRNWDTVLVVLGVVDLDVRNLLLRIAHRCRRLLEAVSEDKNELCRVEQPARRLWPRLLIRLITMDTRPKQPSLGAQRDGESM